MEVGGLDTLICEKNLVVNLFGTMEVRIGDEVMPRLRTRKGYWLLAIMVLNHGREVQREWLAGVLWPDSLESQARANLNLSITDLRNALGKESIRLQSVTRDKLRLDLTGAECDLITFDTLARSKDSANEEKAVSFYRGALLKECYESWVILEREQREQTYLQLLENMAEEAVVRQDWRLAIHLLRVIIKCDPYRDSAQLQLMHALTQGGDPNAALQAYQEFGRFLRQNDPRSCPSVEVEKFYQQIRSKARRLAEDPLPLRSAPALAWTNACIPARITPLIGREKEILQIAMALRKSRLVTLTGSGGVGKTSLAMVVASEEASAYPQGAAFVALEALTDPADISSRILSVLGVSPDPPRQPAETLAEFLAGKSLLLVLDNLEHLLSTGVAQIQNLLQCCPKITILVTSRQSLGVPDEVAWRVSSLSVPDPRGLPTAETALLALAQQSTAVRLFVERAEAKQADFQLNLRNSRLIIEICSKLDGIPLAIELAAARIVALPVPELSRRLQDCYRALSSANPAALPRHQTLAALMDWSYHLLNEAEQTLLLRLSVFMGGFTLEASEAVCTLPPLEEAQILDLLTSLVNKSLVVYEENDGIGRYRLLEIVKQYAANRLQASGQRELCQERHGAHFLAFAEGQETHLTSAEQVAALDLLDREYDNFQVALFWSAGTAETLETACRLAGVLCYFWAARGHLLEGKKWSAALVSEAGNTSRRVQGKLLLGAAYLAYAYGDSLNHGLYCDAALHVYHSLSDRLGRARTLVMKTRSWGLSNRAALEALHESLEVFRAEEDAEGIAATLCQMASRWGEGNTPPQRIAWFEEGLRLYRARQDLRNIAVMSGELGYLILKSGGDRETARALFEEMQVLSVRVRDQNTQSHSFWLLGNADLAAGDYAAAERHFTQGLALIRQLGGKAGIALILTSLAEVKQWLGQKETACVLAEESLTLYQDLGYVKVAEGVQQILQQIRNDEELEPECFNLS